MPDRDETTSKAIKELKRMRRVATLLLCCMASIFILTLALEKNIGSLSFNLELLRAFSEAAMVGALADWFAVTALFRHPLGIPIPHTAIIPSNKAQIGRNLGTFIERNFLELSEDEKNSPQFDFAEAFARWLSNRENQTSLATRITNAVPEILKALGDEDVKRILANTLNGAVERIKLAPFSASVLQILVEEKSYPQMFEHLMWAIQRFLHTNRGWVSDHIRNVTPWFVPNFVNSPIIERILDRTELLLEEARANPNHEFRQSLHSGIKDLIEQLSTSSELSEKIDNIKEDLLKNDSFRAYLQSVAGNLQTLIVDDVESSKSLLHATVSTALSSFYTTLSSDQRLREKLNRSIRFVLRQLIGEHRGSAADFIARTVERWDTNSIVDKIEAYVGKDLQYIRINGTIVGGIVGVLIVFVERLVHAM